MILIVCLLNFMGLVKAVELTPSSSNPFLRPPGPFYSVSLASRERDEHEEKGHRSLVEDIPSCRAFKFALDNVALGRVTEFIMPNYILKTDPKVLCAQTACEAPLALFIKQFTTQDEQPLKVIRFLAQAETHYFPNDADSLKRRYMALLYAVQKEQPKFVSELLKCGAPVYMRGRKDLLLELVANCGKRMEASHHNSRSGACYSMCSAGGSVPTSEDSAYKIATLLIAKEAPVAKAAGAANGTDCRGEACVLLRKHYRSSDPPDRKSREKSGSQKPSSPDPSLLGSSPEQHSSYLTALSQNEDGIEITDSMEYVRLEDEEGLR